MKLEVASMNKIILKDVSNFHKIWLDKNLLYATVYGQSLRDRYNRFVIYNVMIGNLFSIEQYKIKYFKTTHLNTINLFW